MQSKMTVNNPTTLADELIHLFWKFLINNQENDTVKDKCDLAIEIITEIETIALKYPEDMLEILRVYFNPYCDTYGNDEDEFGKLIQFSSEYLDNTITYTYTGIDLSPDTEEYTLLSKKITQDAKSLKKTAKRLDFGRLGKLDIAAMFNEMYKDPDEFGGENECVFIHKIIRNDNKFLQNKYTRVLKGLSSSSLTCTPSLGVTIQGLSENLDSHKNETYLYHGTSLFTAGKIAKYGFQSEWFNSYHFFRGYGPLGRGTYLTDQLPKAALYSPCTLCKELRCICVSKLGMLIPKAVLVCKVALGNVEFIQNKDLTIAHDSQIQDKGYSRVAMNKEINPDSEFDSNEFSVKNDSAVYPQYIILYHHTRNMLKRHLLLEELSKVDLDREDASILLLDKLVSEYEQLAKHQSTPQRLLLILTKISYQTLIIQKKFPNKATSMLMMLKYLSDFQINTINQEHPESLNIPDMEENTMSLMEKHCNAFSELVKKLIKRFYHNPKADYEFTRRSASHGPMHVCRVALYIPLLIQFYKSVGVQEVNALSPEDIFYLQVAAIMHDCARREDAFDYWDEESAFTCKRVFLELGCDEHTASLYADAIRYKDKAFKDKNIYQKLMHDADCLDVMRVRSIFWGHRFDINYLDIYKILVGEHNESAIPTLIDFVLAIREFIVMQYDMKYATAIDLNGTQVSDTIFGNRDKDIKRQYDEAEDCYNKIIALLTSMPEKGILPLVALWNAHDLVKPPNIGLKIEQFSDEHDIDYLIRILNKRFFSYQKNLSIQQIKLSVSGNLHLILKATQPIDNTKAFIQNYASLRGKIKCINLHEQVYSVLSADIPDFLNALHIDYGRFRLLINDRLYKLLNNGGCIFVKNNQCVYAYGPSFANQVELTLEQLTDKLVTQKNGGFRRFWTSDESYPENIAMLIETLYCKDVQMSSAKHFSVHSNFSI